MKTKAMVATLLIAAAASADARFAWPYPRKTVSPDEIGHWVVINDNAWPDSAESEFTTASPSGGEPDGLKSSPTKKEEAELKTGVFHSAWPASPLVHRIPTNQDTATVHFDLHFNETPSNRRSCSQVTKPHAQQRRYTRA
jgi:hypothetical protein